MFTNPIRRHKTNYNTNYKHMAGSFAETYDDETAAEYLIPKKQVACFYLIEASSHSLYSRSTSRPEQGWKPASEKSIGSLESDLRIPSFSSVNQDL